MNSIIRIIPFSLAARTIIALNIVVITFHMLVMAQIIPYNIVWAGRLKNEREMYVFEALSIVINFVLIVTVLAKTKNIKLNRSQKIVDVTLWLFVIVFVLNSLGNLTAKASLETYIATPLTLILALLCWRVATRSPAGHAQQEFQNKNA